MADNLRKFTTQEVLNKVYSDSSGNSIGINAATSKETLNAALDTSNSRLNVSLAGGTIGGDVTINGDLTVNGDGAGAYDEIINGQLEVRGDATDSATGMTGFLTLSTAFTDINATDQLGRINFQAPLEAGGTDAILAGASIYGIAEATFANNNNSTGIAFATATSSAPIERMRIDSSGNVGIGTSSPVTMLNLKGDGTSIITLETSDTTQEVNNLTGAIYFRGNDATSGAGGTRAMIKANAQDSSGGHYMSFATAPSAGTVAERVRIDMDGNVGIGASPITTQSTVTQLTLGGNSLISSHTATGASGALRIGQNSYLNSSGNTAYVSEDQASMYTQKDGTHKFQVVGSGTGVINTSFIDALLIDNSGNATFAGDVTSNGNILSQGASAPSISVLDTTNNASIQMRALDSEVRFGTTSNHPVKIGINSSFDVIVLGTDKSATFGGDVFIKNSGNNDPSTLSLWSSDTSIADDDNIGVILAQGSDSGGSPPYTGAKIEFNADATWDTGTSNYYATRIDFFTQSNNGTDTLATSALSINSNKAVFFGKSTVTGSGTASIIHASNDYMYIKGGSSGLILGDDIANSNIQINNDGSIYQIVAGNVKMLLDVNSRISLSNNDSGTSNTVFGKLAGANIDDGSNYNTFIGENVADASLNDATDNIGVGYYALSSLTTGDNNVVMGSSAGINITGTSSTVLIGHQAGNAINNADADGTVAVGYQSLKAITNGGKNVALGYLAGSQITTGDSNIALGHQAMDEISTGDRNIAIGHNAIGNAQGGDTSGGSKDNIAIGFQSQGGAWADAECLKNTSIGSYSLDGALDGALQNTALGYSSLGAVTQGDNNVAVGMEAGDNITTGTKNVTIGQQARTSAVGGTNQIVIGATATGIADNSVSLGNSSVTKLYVGAGGTEQSIVFRDSADQGQIIYSHSNEQFQFKVGGDSIKARIRSGGDLYLDGGQITFPADQVPSSDANTLDDYEEGLYTPSITGSSSGNYVLNTSFDRTSYTKIGRQVTMTGEVRVASDNSASGTIRVSIPFAVAQLTDTAGISISNIYVSGHGDADIDSNKLLIYLDEGNQYFTIMEVNDDDSIVVLTDSHFDTAFNLTFTFTYFTS
jgi:hypothetical protein